LILQIPFCLRATLQGVLDLTLSKRRLAPPLRFF